MAPVIKNKKAFHEYHVLERFEAGLALQGTEVKSVREGKVSLGDAYAKPKGDELFLVNCHIAEYRQGSYNNHEPLRPRKLLLHRREIKRLLGKLRERGLTLIPLKVFFNDRGFAKVELGLCKGKKLHDKRSDMKRRDAEREIRRAMARPR